MLNNIVRRTLGIGFIAVVPIVVFSCALPSSLESGGVDFKVAPQVQSAACFSLVKGAQADALVAEALYNPQVQQLRQQLELQGFTPNFNEAKAFSMSQNVLVEVPFGNQAKLLYLRTPQTSNSITIISQGRRRFINLLLPGGQTEATLLRLHKDQVSDIIQQVGNILEQYGIMEGYVWGVINETRREVLLSVRGRVTHLVAFEALSWSESGPVTAGAVKRSPKLLDCNSTSIQSVAVGERRHGVRLVPLARFVPCAGDGKCVGGSLYNVIYLLICDGDTCELWACDPISGRCEYEGTIGRP